MNESTPTPESPRVSREDVIAAYKKFVDAGFSDPGELDLSDPEVEKANELYFAWIAQGDAEDPEHGEVWRRHELDKTMINIDAGFTGETFLMDALDWLSQDAQNAEKIPDDAERAKTRDIFAAAIRKVRKLLDEKAAQQG